MKKFLFFIVIIATFYYIFNYLSGADIKVQENSRYKEAGIEDLVDGNQLSLQDALIDVTNEVNSLTRDVQGFSMESIPQKIEKAFIAFFNKHIANTDKEFFENLEDDKNLNSIDFEKK